MKPIRIVLLAICCLAPGACSNQYFERKDSITFSAGDAVATNEAVQIPDPWPPGSQNNNIPMDGVKAALAIERYRAGGAAPPSTSNFFFSTGGAGPGTAGGPAAPSSAPGGGY